MSHLVTVKKLGDVVDIYSLQIGDYFVEDCYYYPVYKVVRYYHINGMNVVMAYDMDTGEESEWGYKDPAFAPQVIKVEEIKG